MNKILSLINRNKELFHTDISNNNSALCSIVSEAHFLVIGGAGSIGQAVTKEIIEEIKLLKGKKTLIVIAHRLTTIEHCDRIFRLERGKVVQQGSYKELFKK